jgi:hypothetical protein
MTQHDRCIRKRRLGHHHHRDTDADTTQTRCHVTTTTTTALAASCSNARRRRYSRRHQVAAAVTTRTRCHVTTTTTAATHDDDDVHDTVDDDNMAAAVFVAQRYVFLIYPLFFSTNKLFLFFRFFKHYIYISIQLVASVVYLYVIIVPKSVVTDSSCTTTGRGRVGLNRLLYQVEPHTTGCVRFDPVFCIS